MSTITYEQFIKHILSDAGLKSLLERISVERQYIDDHHIRFNEPPKAIDYLLLVAPVTKNGHLCTIRGDIRPWVSPVGRHMMRDPYAQWGHCKNPLVINEEDNKIHVTTSAHGHTIYEQPGLNQIHISEFWGEFGATNWASDANMVITIDQLALELHKVSPAQAQLNKHKSH